jgi:hypothetical protein
VHHFIAEIPDDIRAALEAGTKLTNEQKKTYDKIQKKNARNAVRKVQPDPTQPVL